MASNSAKSVAVAEEIDDLGEFSSPRLLAGKGWVWGLGA